MGTHGRRWATNQPLNPRRACVLSSQMPAKPQVGQLKICARSSTDRASDYGSEGWGFESLRARKRIRRSGLLSGVFTGPQSASRTGFCHRFDTRARKMSPMVSPAAARSSGLAWVYVSSLTSSVWPHQAARICLGTPAAAIRLLIVWRAAGSRVDRPPYRSA
jgi:hypothetical protein